MNNRGAAGIKRPTVASMQQSQAMAAIDAALDAAGWPLERIIQGLGELAQANKKMLAQKDGEFTDEMDVPDNPARQAALHTMLQLRRAYPAAKVEVGGTVRVEQLFDIAMRLESLPLERLNEIIDAEDAVLALPERAADYGETREAPNAESREADLPRL